MFRNTVNNRKYKFWFASRITFFSPPNRVEKTSYDSELTLVRLTGPAWSTGLMWCQLAQNHIDMREDTKIVRLMKRPKFVRFTSKIVRSWDREIGMEIAKLTTISWEFAGLLYYSWFLILFSPYRYHKLFSLISVWNDECLSGFIGWLLFILIIIDRSFFRYFREKNPTMSHLGLVICILNTSSKTFLNILD